MTLDVAALSAALAARGRPDKKAWWERYLKDEIAFFGVPMSEIRAEVRRWAGPDPDPTQLRHAGFALVARPIAEEKLAGILVMQELLIPVGGLDPSRDLPTIALLFDDGHIGDWNTTDWLCVRVLGPLIQEGGISVARQTAAWADAPSLWRRRASMVALVPPASRGDAVFPGLVDLILRTCAANAADTERFVQTGIGWVLRELSDVAPAQVFRFLGAHPNLSREAVRMAAARLDDARRTALGITGERRRR